MAYREGSEEGMPVADVLKRKKKRKEHHVKENTKAMNGLQNIDVENIENKQAEGRPEIKEFRKNRARRMFDTSEKGEANRYATKGICGETNGEDLQSTDAENTEDKRAVRSAAFVKKRARSLFDTIENGESYGFRVSGFGGGEYGATAGKSDHSEGKVLREAELFISQREGARIVDTPDFDEEKTVSVASSSCGGREKAETVDMPCCDEGNVTRVCTTSCYGNNVGSVVASGYDDKKSIQDAVLHSAIKGSKVEGNAACVFARADTPGEKARPFDGARDYATDREGTSVNMGDNVEEMREHARRNKSECFKEEKTGNAKRRKDDLLLMEVQHSFGVCFLTVIKTLAILVVMNQCFLLHSSTPDFHSMTGDTYTIGNSIRSRVLIITATENREGYEYDIKCLERLFESWNCPCTVVLDKDSDSVKEEMNLFALSRDNNFTDSVFIIFMGHGGMDKSGKDFIQTKDDERLVLQDTIRECFNNTSCPALAKKPKIFIFQSCRVKDATPEDLDNFPCINLKLAKKSDHHPQMQNGTIGFHPVNLDDYVFAYACQPGEESKRDIHSGSWFIQEMVKVFKEKAHKEHIVDMLTEVKERVLSLSQNHDRVSPETVTGLKKKFYIRPETK